MRDSKGGPGRKRGTLRTGSGAAETPEQAHAFVGELEDALDPANFILESAADEGPLPEEAMGVLWRSERHYFGQED